jgi:hypothetical protein
MRQAFLNEFLRHFVNIAGSASRRSGRDWPVGANLYCKIIQRRYLEVLIYEFLSQQLSNASGQTASPLFGLSS